MRNIYAYKIELNKDGVIIKSDALTVGLATEYRRRSSKTELLMPLVTVSELRKIFFIHQDVSNMFWIERTLRKSNGINQILQTVRDHHLDYEISTYTLCPLGSRKVE